MKLVAERSPLPRVLAWLYLAVAAGGAFLLLLCPEAVVRWARCPWREATGWPCLTCGGTHAAIALVRLRLAEAFRLNPFVVVAAAALLIWGLWATVTTAVPAWRRELRFSPIERRVLRTGLGILVVSGWLYQILQLGVH